MTISGEEKKAEFRRESLVHLETLYGLGLRLTGGDESEAEDLVRQTILEAYRAWDHYETGTNCRAWLMAILEDIFLDGFRDPGPRAGPQGGDRPDEASVFRELRDADPEEGFLDRLGDPEIAAAIEDLEDALRVPLVLADLQGLSYQEVAEAMEVPVGTVKSRLFRARRRLQEGLYDRARRTGRLG